MTSLLLDSCAKKITDKRKCVLFAVLKLNIIVFLGFSNSKIFLKDNCYAETHLKHIVKCGIIIIKAYIYKKMW